MVPLEKNDPPAYRSPYLDTWRLVVVGVYFVLSLLCMFLVDIRLGAVMCVAMSFLVKMLFPKAPDSPPPPG